MKTWGVVSILFAALLAAAPAHAATLHVPGQYAGLQQAIDAAAPHDLVVVEAGRYCGASVDKPLQLIGRGQPTIIGCAKSPTLAGVLRVGLLLDGAGGASPASGTTIRGFDFDGAGISNANTAPLAFGVFARFASDVVVENNRFTGTVQAITNTAGDRWRINANEIRELTLFDCTGFCGGGDGIVIQSARDALALPTGPADPANRPELNEISFNAVSGALPANVDAFSLVGVLVMAADGTLVLGNRLALTSDPSGAARAEGIVVTNQCCGEEQHLLPGSRAAAILGNDGRASDYVLVVEGGPGENSAGLLELFNSGRILRQDQGQTALALLPSARKRWLSPIHAPF